jgi:peptide chain release factor 2
MKQIQTQIENLKEKIENIKEKISFSEKIKKAKELEEESKRPDFWGFPDKAAQIMKQLNELTEEINFWLNAEKETNDLAELLKKADNDDELILEVQNQLNNIEHKIKEKELTIFLSGPYDRNEAIMIITAGQGGRDAEDFCRMLLKMYCRYFEKKNWPYQIIHQHFSEEGGGSKEAGGEIGLKNVSIEINTPYAYGFLKNESGVHRLVRVSPFDAKKLRHTSFALVEVLPQIEDVDLKNIEINEADLKFDFFRSSGPGGQNVNKRETAVRVVHLPTGLSASCQTERFQAQNREKALHLLKIKLFNLLQQQKNKERNVLKQKVEPSWGNQIRNYVLHPYKLVKDLRTDIETNQIYEVLDGDLDSFIQAEILLNR